MTGRAASGSSYERRRAGGGGSGPGKEAMVGELGHDR